MWMNWNLESIENEETSINLIVASFKDAFDFKSKKNINRQIE
jgi:hypothetical protein